MSDAAFNFHTAPQAQPTPTPQHTVNLQPPADEQQSLGQHATPNPLPTQNPLLMLNHQVPPKPSFFGSLKYDFQANYYSIRINHYDLRIRQWRKYVLISCARCNALAMETSQIGADMEDGLIGRKEGRTMQMEATRKHRWFTAQMNRYGRYLVEAMGNMEEYTRKRAALVRG